jgi:hypothetical protein
LVSLLCRELVVAAPPARITIDGNDSSELHDVYNLALSRGAGDVMEIYIELCFNEGSDSVKDAVLLSDFVAVLAGKDVVGLPGVSDHYDNILQSEASGDACGLSPCF